MQKNVIQKMAQSGICLVPCVLCQYMSRKMYAAFAQNFDLLHVKLCTSHLCIKMSAFLYAHPNAMWRILYSSCGILFPVWTTDNICGLTSIFVWLEVIRKKNQVVL